MTRVLKLASKFSVDQEQDQHRSFVVHWSGMRRPASGQDRQTSILAETTG
jgi:hypothetical protein